MLVAAMGWVAAVVASALALALHLRGANRQRNLEAVSLELRERDASARTLLQTLLDASPVAFVLLTEVGKIVVENAAARRVFFEDRSAEGQNFLRLAANVSQDLQSALARTSDAIVSLHVDGQYETFHFARRTLGYLGMPHTLVMVRPMTSEVAAHDIDVLKRVVRLISHEVNNSLAPISSLTHSGRVILGSGERLQRLERVFDTVEDRCRHLDEFIAGYAALARLPPPAPRALEWSALLEPLSSLYPDAQLSAPPGSQGYFDPAQLEQALINLLKNARESGGPAEAVQLRVTTLDDQAATVDVLDRGSGFSEEALEHALLPFYTTKPGGSGVGLALVREIVHAHGGRLTLGAREGGGAAVRVWLPGPSRAAAADDIARLTLTRA